MMATAKTSLTLTFVLAVLYVTIPFSKALLPFRNTSLSWDARVDDLVSRLTLTEIEHQMARGGAGLLGGPAPALLLLGIKHFAWNTECLAGDVQAGEATSFPQPIGLAASFSSDLVSRVSEAIGTEVRAKYNQYRATNSAGDHKGAACFSPVVNIMRDPRWGRNQETYGEDPFLTGELAASFVKGLQGSDPRYVRASAGCKHLDVYGGPENIPTSRFSFDAKVSDNDYRMTFLPAFQKCVDAGTLSLMCSYNSINGVPSCANKKLLTDILRDEWGFKGYVVSDQGALENIVNEHKYVDTYTEAAAEAVNAGVNLEVSNNKLEPVFMSLRRAVQNGEVNETTVRERVKSLFYTRMRLGEFDPDSMNPYSKLGASNVLTPEHRALSEEAAKSSFVLLKNEDDMLPLKNSTFSSIAVVGPMADNDAQMYGLYSVDLDPTRASTPKRALSELTPNLRHASGCDDNQCFQYSPNDVRNAITGSDIVFVVVGTGQSLESEGNDRKDISLPGHQFDLVQDAVKYAEGRPVILVVFSAGPVDIQWAATHVGVKAIIQVFFPAETAGVALRKVLLNDGPKSSPAGRLPYTWYLGTYPPFNMTDYSMQGRTYRYIDPKNAPGKVLYPFGYGLSYSSFAYSNLQLPVQVSAGHSISGSVTVLNKGPVDADEVIQIYLEWTDLPDGIPHPMVQLVLFKRLHLKNGQSVEFSFTVDSRQIALFHDGAWFVSPGQVKLSVGGQQPYQTVQLDSNILQDDVTILDH